MRRIKLFVPFYRTVLFILALIFGPASVARAADVTRSSQNNTALKVFVPPADLNDFPPEKEEERQKFVELWSNNINQWTEQAILGDVWTTLYDSPRPYYYNPLTTLARTGSEVVQVNWFPFPNRLNAYFSDRFSREELLELADNGALSNGQGIPEIPSNVCPEIDHTSKPKKYSPGGPRGWQDEYCEWSVKRDPGTNNILSVMFTAENPDYWRALWATDPDLVVALYRKILNNAQVSKDDLYLRKNGKIVIDPITERPAYDITNKWNNGTQTLADRGGAMHLTSSPNTLRAEIYIAASASNVRKSARNPHDLLCAFKYGEYFRNSDPHLSFVVNQLVKNLRHRVSLASPVGLYIQEPDFSRYTLPPQAPKGVMAKDFWKVARGQADGYALHTVFEVPANYGFTVSDIQIDGKPIRWASQIVETFKIGMNVRTLPLAPTAKRRPLPDVKDRNLPLAQPILIAGFDVLDALPSVDRDTPWFAPTIKRGRTIRGLGLACRATDERAAIKVIGGRGVELKVNGVKKRPSDFDGTITIFNVEVRVAKDARLGSRDIQVTNPGAATGPPARGFLRIVEEGKY
jgi:hypothetical protein